MGSLLSLSNLRENPEIDSQLSSFTEKTRIPLRLISVRREIIWESNLVRKKSHFCQMLRTGGDGARKCQSAYRKSVQESIRWGEAAIGKCCEALMQITAPVMDNGKLGGYLVASPFLLVDPSELQPEELTFLEKRPEKRKLKMALSAIPIVEDEDAKQAAKDLFRLADRLSIPDLSCLRMVREIQDLQGKIVDRISDLKASDNDFSASFLTKLSYEQEKEIVTRIRLGDREGAEEILYRLLAILLSQYIENFELLKISVLEILIILTRAAVEAGTKIEEVLGMKYRFITESAGIRDQENLCIWVVQVLEKLMDGIYQTRNVNNYQRLKGAYDFVEAHYQEPLTVEQIAREVCLSPSRFSHIMKSEMGVTLGNCISKVRIEKAKSLLRETEMSISQVALEVGFPDQSYFTKVFKKIENRTPKAYRENSRHLGSALSI